MASAPPLRRTAFTLVELLVSITVLVLLIVMVVQLLNGATAATTNSRKHLDADGQARLIFDRMAVDFDRMFKRRDVDYAFLKQTSASGQGANDSLFFYSEAPGYFSGAANQSSVSLVGYRINSTNVYHPGVPVLERLGKALTFDGTPNQTASPPVPGSPIYLTYAAASTPPPSPSPTPAPVPLTASTIAGRWPLAVSDPAVVTGAQADPDFQSIGDQVYRLEYCFLLTNGAYSNYPSINPPPYASANGMQDVSAVVVALAILDSTSQKIVSDYSKMVTALADPTDADLAAAPPRLMATTWLAAINSGTLAQTAGLPPAVAGQVRVYQRSFFLNK